LTEKNGTIRPKYTRASIDRIQGIKISVPPLAEQEKTVSEIEKIGIKQNALGDKLDLIPKQKEAVLKKYL